MPHNTSLWTLSIEVILNPIDIGCDVRFGSIPII